MPDDKQPGYEPSITTAHELLERLEEGYRRHLAIRDRKVLEGKESAINTLEEYETFEMGMRTVIWHARVTLGLDTSEWEI